MFTQGYVIRQESFTREQHSLKNNGLVLSKKLKKKNNKQQTPSVFTNAIFWCRLCVCVYLLGQKGQEWSLLDFSHVLMH